MPISNNENKEKRLYQYFSNVLSLTISGGNTAAKTLFLRRRFFSFFPDFIVISSGVNISSNKSFSVTTFDSDLSKLFCFSTAADIIVLLVCDSDDCCWNDVDIIVVLLADDDNAAVVVATDKRGGGAAM